jgi:hypothetical protein
MWSVASDAGDETVLASFATTSLQFPTYVRERWRRNERYRLQRFPRRQSLLLCLSATLGSPALLSVKGPPSLLALLPLRHLKSRSHDPKKPLNEIALSLRTYVQEYNAEGFSASLLLAVANTDGDDVGG